ncbi:MAG: hypothetical protein ABIN97_17475 [Ginsengibacter sp.]
MKMQIKNYVLSFISILLLIGFSCQKKDNIYDFDKMILGSYLTLVKTNNTTIDFANLATSKVSIQVGSKGSPVEKVNVFVVEGASLDKTKWKLVKSVPFTEGVILEVSATEIAAAVGAIKPGSTYTLYNEVVTTDGRKFSSINTDADFEGQAGYKMAMSWTATTTCPYDQSVFTGSFSVTKDTWQDYAIGDLVNVQPGPGANQITIFVYPSPAYGTNRKGVVINVNPTDRSINIPEQIVGDYGTDTDVAMLGAGSVNSCTKTITITGIVFKQGGAIYAAGPYALTLKQ